MAWGTPSVVTSRGRHVRHHYITAVGTLNGATAISLDLDTQTIAGFTSPLAIFGGSMTAKCVGGTATDVTTLVIRAGATTWGDRAVHDIWREALTLVSTPDSFHLLPLFHTTQSYDGVAGIQGNAQTPGGNTFVLSTNELRIFAVSDNAAETTATVEFWLCLMSYVLEV